jgi:hypothetical protein
MYYYGRHYSRISGNGREIFMGTSYINDPGEKLALAGVGNAGMQ